MSNFGATGEACNRSLDLNLVPNEPLRVSAVSYLNTVPLVWGMLHGPEQAKVQVSFSLPSECASKVEEGRAEIGLVPLAEIARQGLEIASSVGITCRGPVRSILLFARVPWPRIRTLAADASSRTSVQLARIILRERYGALPAIQAQRPDLERMLESADAALIIGDPALRIDPERVRFASLDLGSEWFALTSLPMVFAAWAGKPGVARPEIEDITRASYLYGRNNMEAILQAECETRAVSRDLGREYLARHIRFEIGREEREGIKAFLDLAGLLEPAVRATAY
jgi:chorismate dehydratase